MIRLASNPTPAATHRLARLETQRAAHEAVGTPLPKRIAGGYRHRDVKGSLRAETHEKCAYCESRFNAVYFGDVEHIIPVDAHEHLRFNYHNLTIACAICNNNKRHYYNPAAPVFSPYDARVDTDIVAVGALMWHRNGSADGRRTIELLKLNRAELLEKREEKLKRVSDIADRYIAEPPGAIRDSYFDQVVKEAEADSEYARTVRDFLAAAYGIHLP